MKITRASGFGRVVTGAFWSPEPVSPVELGREEFVKAVIEQVKKKANKWLASVGSSGTYNTEEELANDVFYWIDEYVREQPTEKESPTVHEGNRILEELRWLDAGGAEKEWEEAEPQREEARAVIKRQQAEEYAREYPKVMQAPWRQPRYRQDTE